MIIQKIYSAKPTVTNTNKASVKSTPNEAKPSFGFLLSPKQGKLIREYLPPKRQEFYSQKIMDLMELATQKTKKASKARDKIMKQSLKEAKLTKKLADFMSNTEAKTIKFAEQMENARLQPHKKHFHFHRVKHKTA